MSKVKVCSHCGAKMVTYSHTLNFGLAIGISKLYKSGGIIHLKNLGLTIDQFNNFQKLRYWGMVLKSADDSGIWRITEIGEKFINGHPVPKKVFTYRNRVVGSSSDLVTINDLRNKYKKRKDYINE